MSGNPFFSTVFKAVLDGYLVLSKGVRYGWVSTILLVASPRSEKIMPT